MKYKISQAASRDIENIWFYTIEKWSIEQADRYFNLIMDEIEYLAIVNCIKEAPFIKDFDEFKTYITKHTKLQNDDLCIPLKFALTNNKS